MSIHKRQRRAKKASERAETELGGSLACYIHERRVEMSLYMNSFLGIPTPLLLLFCPNARQPKSHKDLNLDGKDEDRRHS